jgi:hypothetical protein
MFPEFRNRKTELTENVNSRLIATKGNWKLYTSFCSLQAETEKENATLFSWSANDKRQLRHAEWTKINGKRKSR